MEYLFEPEKINEGGIKMKNWPKKKKGEYKTFRFWKYYGNGNWPWLYDDDILDKWSNSEDKIIFDVVYKPRELYKTKKHWLDSYDKNEKILLIHLFLKAFHGAPCWTYDELNKIEKCFKKIGFIQIGEYPKEKLLCQFNDKNLEN